MEVYAFLREVEQSGVQLWNDNGQLRYRAPKNAMTPELVARLKTMKETILPLLPKQPAPPRLQAVAPRRGIPPRAPAYARTAPLSLNQMGLWFVMAMAESRNGPGGDAACNIPGDAACNIPGDAAYNIPEALRLDGDIDVSLMRRCLQRIVDRHEALRVSFIEGPDGPRQHIAEQATLAMTEEDLSSLEPGAAERAAAKQADAEAIAPFDLSRAPLVRARLLKLGPQRHVLLFTLHHIIADGWSKGILTRELMTLYAGSGEPPPLTTQYPDYACWQQQSFLSSELPRLRDYWLPRLQNPPPPPDLPFDHPRPRQRSYRGASHFITLSADRGDALQALAKRQGCSLFMALLAIFNILLQRYSGASDLVVGTQVANRERPELENVVGFFVNTLALRVDLSGVANYIELLQQVRETTLGAFAHQEMPFDKLVEALQPERRPGYEPIAQVMFLLQSAPMESLRLPRLTIESLPVNRGSAKFDLSLLVTETDGALQCEFEYGLDLFEPGTIERMARHFANLVDSVIAAPLAELDQLTMIDAGDLRQLRAFNAHWHSAPSAVARPVEELILGDDIVSCFRQQAARRPQQNAVIADDGALSYAELDHRSEVLAARLRHQGALPDQPVGLCVRPGVNLIVGILGILKSGAGYMPMDIAHPRARLQHQINDARLTLIVVDQATLDPARSAVAPYPAELVCIEQALAKPVAAPAAAIAIQRSQLAYVIYTSGSTGAPKGSLVEHHNVLNLVEGLRDLVYQDYQEPVCVALLASPIFDASVQQIFAALLLGHQLLVAAPEMRLQPTQLAQCFLQHKVAVADCTPSLLSMMVAERLPATPGLGLDALLTGGEPLSRKLAQAFYQQNARAALYNVYGPTECAVDVTALRVPRKNPYYFPIVPIGRPLPNAQVFILDTLRRPVPLGVPGQIFIGGDPVGRGYLNRSALTREKFAYYPEISKRRLYATGDCGRWLRDGVIQYLGRMDQQIKIRGHRVEPGEIESHLRQHPAIAEAAAIALETETGRYELAAYLTLVDKAQAPGVEALRNFLQERTPDYMIPTRWSILAQMPLTASNKIDRRALPGCDAVVVNQEARPHRAPNGARETALTEVWRSVLNVAEISALDDYFALGGDSIKALQISARLRQIGWRMEVRQIFEHRSIAELAPHLQATVASTPPDTAPAEAPLTAIQRWFFTHFEGRRDHYNQAVLLRPARALQTDPLRFSLTALARWHGALRLAFQPVRDRMRQVRVEIDPDSLLNVIDLPAADNPQTDMETDMATRQTGFNLQQGGLFKAVLYRLPDGGQRLFLVAHHLIMDAVSWRILLEDLTQAYQQALNGADITLAPATDFTQWAQAVNSGAPVFSQKELDYWGRQETRRAGQSYPSRMQVQSGASHYVESHLDAAATAQWLRDANQSYRTRGEELLVTALLRTLMRQELGPPSLLLEGHGREDLGIGLDVSRTLGWFTSLYPLAFAISADDDVDRQIKVVKETLRSAPQQGAGYGILRYMRDQQDSDRGGALNFAPLPRVAFNYLGQFDRTFAGELFQLAEENVGPTRDPQAPNLQALEVVALVLDGCLQLRITGGSGAFSAGDLVAFAEALMDDLRRIIRHAADKSDAELTPADIDYDGFNLEELDEFIDRLSY
ncbi:Non-ribosomal peptide synthetase modules and related protein [Hahella chejuensis KCTC 2396]|uniref:Non-ribosomal peptide synthetase modules and related protein n=1 Tax=Hahella chejuensis (strain KCTC 2396) TaxID=349521 RepID=Q2SHZ1_HAHCH|nr:non-ribosomal peptide synthetase [Hahella chejuensis]ABC29733.1 Non-ribosomal peptide synthetase modules and related protein [Hahella chejuensis KCTC 2396]